MAAQVSLRRVAIEATDMSTVIALSSKHALYIRFYFSAASSSASVTLQIRHFPTDQTFLNHQAR